MRQPDDLISLYLPATYYAYYGFVAGNERGGGTNAACETLRWMERDTKFGYGFLLAGTALPLLIDKLLGIVPALITGAIFLIVGIALLVSGQRHKPAVPLTSEAWNDLAEKFRNLDKHIWAEWYSETLGFDGKLVGEHWLIRGDPTREAEALCTLAGAMLSRSKELRKELSKKVLSRSDDAWRWLYFLAENHGAMRDSSHGEVTVSGFKMKDKGGTVDHLPAASASACIKCAAKSMAASGR